MEHSALKPQDLAAGATDSLFRTCRKLAETTKGYEISEDESYTLVTGYSDYTLANFAMKLNLDPNSAARLAAVVSNKNALQIYLSQEDRPDHAAALLTSAGLQHTHSLIQMATEVRDPGQVDIELHVASTPLERTRVADFMVTQFFSRHPAAFRAEVLNATASAESLELRYFLYRGEIAGACMLDSTNEIVGLYNFCVRHNLRGHGWGSEALKSLRADSCMRNKILVLHCSQSLESWYIRRGFANVGTIKVFGLFNRENLDIM